MKPLSTLIVTIWAFLVSASLAADDPTKPNIVNRETGARLPTPKPIEVPGNVLTDFSVTPPNPPNEGILFANHEPRSRSGHLGHALMETRDGDLIAFYPDCSEDDEGHSGVGWMEVRRSTDGGQTWSEPEPHTHSRQVYDESDATRAALCEKAVRTDEGDLVLFYLNIDNSQNPRWKPQFVPTYARSEDDGATWSEVEPLGDEPGRVYDALIHDGEIFVLQFANDCADDWRGTSPEHVYLLYASSDGGRTFQKRCVLPFETLGRGYGTLGVLSSGELIAYIMNLKVDEFGPLEAYISGDGGKTWSEPRTIEFSKAVRNQQLIEMDGTYFMHGRARGGSFVIYRSPDGIHWDEGLILRRVEAGAGAYSNSLVVGASDPETTNRLLIQASHAYRKSRTNVLQWWLEARDDEPIALTDPLPLVPLDGGEVVARRPGVLGWTDRNYRLTEWPKALDQHRILHRAPMKRTRFEVFRPGYVVVLTPEKERFNQSGKLGFSGGFERVDLPPFHPYETRPGTKGNRCIALQRTVQTGEVIEFGYYGIALWSEHELPVKEGEQAEPFLPIPTLDISEETERHSFVARGTEETYQGHPDTVLYPDGKTMFATWAIRHAGYLGPLAKSTDAGRTWSEVMPTHPSWKEQTTTTPTIHRLVDPEGNARLFVFAGLNFPGRLRYSCSEDDGETWTPMIETGLKAECPPKTILRFDGGKRLVMWCDRRDPESSAKEDKDPVVWQSESLDGGLTWSPERVVLKTASRWSQPAVIASEDGETLIMLLRNNFRDYGQFAVSHDRGKTWSEAKPLPLALTGHRPAVKRAPDGRLVVVMRDTARDFENGTRRNPTSGHFVAWVGTFEDILEGRDGQYRVKLLHSHAGSDTGYSGLEVLPDGTFVATTYVKYRPGPEQHSVVTTRFRLDELDARAEGRTASARVVSLTGCVGVGKVPMAVTDLQVLIDEQIERGAERIVVPPGDYRVRPRDQVHLRLSGLKNRVVCMAGVRMICSETTRALDVRGCEDVTVQGLTIDYDPLPFTQFVITAMARDKHWLDMRLPAGYGINDLTTFADLGHLAMLDPDTGQLRVIYGGPDRIEKTGPCLYRYTKHPCYRYDPERFTEKVGDIVVVNNHHAPGGRSNHAVLIGTCTNLVMEDITVYAAPMMAFFEGSCNGVTYRRCITDRCPPGRDYREREVPRMRSAGRDGFHLLANRGKTVLDGCVSRFNDDDGVNIHGSGNAIDHIEGRMAVVGDKHGKLTVRNGDRVELISFEGERLGSAEILGVRRGDAPTPAFLTLWKEHIFQNRLAPTKTWVIEFDREVPGAGPGTFVYAPGRVGSNCVIRNCWFGFTRSRGIVLRGSNAVIESNTIEGNWQKGIMVTGEFQSLEGGFPSNVRIVNNRVSSLRHEAVYVGFINPYGTPAPAGLYRGVTIAGNTLSGATVDLFLTSIDGLVLQANQSHEGRDLRIDMRHCVERVEAVVPTSWRAVRGGSD